MNSDLKNKCKNEFKDNNEKLCSWSRNRVSHKIDFKAKWPRTAMPTAWELTDPKSKIGMGCCPGTISEFASWDTGSGSALNGHIFLNYISKYNYNERGWLFAKTSRRVVRRRSNQSSPVSFRSGASMRREIYARLGQTWIIKFAPVLLTLTLLLTSASWCLENQNFECRPNFIITGKSEF